LGTQFITTKGVHTGGSGAEQDMPASVLVQLPLEPVQLLSSLTVTHWYEAAHALSAVHDVET
jgi:hypothetical protein